MCEEVILDDLGNLKGDFVTLSQTGLRKMQGKKKGVICEGQPKSRMITNLSDQLHDFRQILLHLQNLPDLGPQSDEFRVKGLIESLEG